MPLTSSGEILRLENQFIASKLPVWPQGTAEHNAAVRGSSVICVVRWPQFIRFVDSDSHLSGLMGLSVQPFCACFPMDLVFRLYDESAHSLRTDANGNKDRCLLICQQPPESASHPKLLAAVWAFGLGQLLQTHHRVVWVCLTKASKSPACWVKGVRLMSLFNQRSGSVSLRSRFSPEGAIVHVFLAVLGIVCG